MREDLFGNNFVFHARKRAPVEGSEPKVGLDQVDLQVPNVAMKRNFFVAKKTKRFQTFLCRFNAKNAACPKRVGTILATFAGGRALREPTPINWLSPQEGTNSFRPIHFPLGVIIHHKIDRVGAIGSFGVVLDGR
jgi:hypothetical protein